MSDKILEPTDSYISTTLNNLGAAYISRGDYVDAIPLYQRALQILEVKPEQDAGMLATALQNIAAAQWYHRDYAKAERVFLQALAIMEKTYGPDDPELVVILENLAMMYREQNKVHEAVPLESRAAKIKATLATNPSPSNNH